MKSSESSAVHSTGPASLEKLLFSDESQDTFASNAITWNGRDS